MTGVPERIWADPPETFDGSDVWRSEPGGKGVECIRADIAAAREAKLIEALRFYADGEWQDNYPGGVYRDGCLDYGDKARTIIAEMEKP
jgi:hypothetical protein